MGESVEFSSNGRSVVGYLASAGEGAGLGVIVIHGDSGPVAHLRDVCDRFAVEGFSALAPEVDSPSGTADLSAAVDFMIGHHAVRGEGVGVVGFGAGGALAMWLGTSRPQEVKAVVPFYGLAGAGTEPDWTKMQAAVEGHFAELDDQNDLDAVHALEQRLVGMGREVRVFIYPNTKQAFFDDTQKDVYDDDAARQAWIRTLEFLRAKLG